MVGGFLVFIALLGYFAVVAWAWPQIKAEFEEERLAKKINQPEVEVMDATQRIRLIGSLARRAMDAEADRLRRQA